jgi:hypothetical protein
MGERASAGGQLMTTLPRMKEGGPYGPYHFSEPCNCPTCGSAFGLIDPTAESARCSCGLIWRVAIAKESEGVRPGERFFLLLKGADVVQTGKALAKLLTDGNWMTVPEYMQFAKHLLEEALGTAIIIGKSKRDAYIAARLLVASMRVDVPRADLESHDRIADAMIAYINACHGTAG